MSPTRCPVCEQSTIRFFVDVATRLYWRCLTCQATFLHPEQLPAKQAELAQYQLHRNDVDDQGYRQFLLRLATPLLARLPPASRGLDYGCGPGPALARIMAEAGHAMALFDPFFQPDQSVLKETYDFVTCTEVAEHFHHPAAEFARLQRLINPRGWLAVMTTFQTDDAAFAHWHYRRDPTHVVFYRETTLRYLADLHDCRCDIPVPNVALLQKGSG
ncbi:MAG: class I SAM-dependent methyltransferase [Nitrosomonas sp.]|nr:class I SAM-dependent methyltransferase [Nitrosomonas sp.]